MLNALLLRVRIGLIGILTIFLLSVSWVSKEQPIEDWIAPKSADIIKNPLGKSPASIEEGKKIFMLYCSICHGNKGKGDGIGGVGLKPRPSNFTIPKVQEQSDGAIYWKLAEGRAPMAGYGEILTETERWQLVSFIRTLKK